MKKVSCALAPLEVRSSSAQSVLLQSSVQRMEISVVAHDLFRVRLARGRSFSPRPSWAVASQAWPSVPVLVRSAPNQVSLQTTGGTLSLRLDNGAWQVRGSANRVVFSAGAAQSGFVGKQAQVTLELSPETSVFGLGEMTGSHNKRGLVREFWNKDLLGHAPAISPGLRNLYVSIPFALVHTPQGSAGLFWDNPVHQTWDIGQTHTDQWNLMATDGEIDLYLFLGPTVPEVVRRYTDLTGRTPLPPRWALGYQQSRYSYSSRERLEEVAATFRKRKIPCDVLYLDIHHMDGFRVFTFGKTYPKPAEMTSNLAKKGFKLVTIVDPGVKDDPKFGVLKRGKAIDAFVKAPGGKKDYIGKVWPGKSRFPDFLNARVRSWWGSEQERLQNVGIRGFWNDMNEPANFALPIKTLPEKCVHRSDHGPLFHSQAHNLYGMQMARASREGALAHDPVNRPFIITRAAYAGIQRYSMVWTGDNSSVWEHLAESVSMLVNLGLSGVPFCGVDAGGFLDHATPELLTRWMQLAAFTPFYRNHTNIDSHDQEPWVFGPRVETICRQYIEWRYRLLFYWYGLFAQAHREGTPMMRPLFWHYEKDPVAVSVDDQFLLGSDLLVAPIIRQGARARSVYLPQGIWWDFWTGQRHEGGNHVVAMADWEVLPMYVRGGTILPLGPVQQYVGQIDVREIELHLWPGGVGERLWYEDDGMTQAYTKGDWSERRLLFQDIPHGGQLRWEARRGPFESRIRQWEVVLHGVVEPTKLQLNGRPISGHWDLQPQLFRIAVPNSDEPMILEWS